MEYLIGAATYLDTIGAGELASQVRGYAGPQDLDAEWQRQTDRAIELGYWKEGYDDPEIYRNSIPKFAQPVDKRLPFPLSIDPRISSSRKLELAGIKPYINVGEIKDEITAPDLPYTVYTIPPTLFRGYYSEALKQIPDYAVGAPASEVFEAYLKLYSKFPQFFNPWADSGNSLAGAGYVPYLHVWRGGPEVVARRADSPLRDWRVLFRGNEIGT